MSARPAILDAVRTLRLPAGALDASDALRLVAAAGLAAVASTLCRSEADALDAAGADDYPVVAKAVARGVVHKSDQGGVRLGLRNAEDLRAAFADMQRQFGDGLEGMLVQPQISGTAELILGTVWDAAFGPFVLVGSGGIFAELIGDTRLALAPVSREAALALLAELKIWPVLLGARGRAKADLSAAADAVVALSWLAAELGPRLAELDVNPLILRGEGRGAVAVDARARLRDSYS